MTEHDDSVTGAPTDTLYPYDSRPESYQHMHVVQRVMLGAIQDLQRRALMHDQTKVTDQAEVELFNLHTPYVRKYEYGTPEYRLHAEKLRSHCLRPENDHHPEGVDLGIHGMHMGQLLEMCCDWIAASRRNPHGDVRASVRKNAERFGYGAELEGLITLTVDWLLALESHEHGQVPE